ncbi:nucleotidyltransferase domain-containing protein [bacterium]|nr:nucleotidyltransferase domain-containing protein [bacterium]
MRFGLTDSDIKVILSTVSQFPEIRQVVIFGSRAKGTHLKGSDIDLAIKGEDISNSTINRLSFLLNEELPLPYFFDVIHYEEIDNKDLKEHIDRVGKSLT